MTNREKADAYFMYLEGSSFQEIADHYGVTKQYIHEILTKSFSRSRGAKRKTIYPKLEDWMNENGITFSKFSQYSGMPYVTLTQILKGKRMPNKVNIDIILKATGLTYEEAFHTEKEQ